MKIEIEEESLAEMLSELRHLREQVKDLQAAGTALVSVRREGDITYNVAEFHKRYGHPVEATPRIPANDMVECRLRLMTEEFFEVLAACLRPETHPVMTVVRDTAYELFKQPDVIQVDLPELADGLCDLDYVSEGTRLVCGIPRVLVLKEVQRSNLEKIPNGLLGKPIKPEGWAPPDIKKVLLESGWSG